MVIGQLLIMALVTGSIYALAAMALSLTYRATGVFNFAGGQLVVLAAFGLILLGDSGMPFAVNAVCLLVTMAAVSVLLSRFVFAPIRGVSPLAPIVATLGIAGLVEGMLSLLFGPGAYSLRLEPSVPVLDRINFLSVRQVGWITMTGAVVAFCCFLSRFTAWGRSLRALHEDPEALQVLGVSTSWVTHSAMALSGALSGLAGLVYVVENNVAVVQGGALSLKAFAAMMVGGAGSIGGAFFGGFVIATLETFSVGTSWFGATLPGGYRDAVALCLLATILLVRPSGIFGRRVRTV